VSYIAEIISQIESSILTKENKIEREFFFRNLVEIFVVYYLYYSKDVEQIRKVLQEETLESCSSDDDGVRIHQTDPKCSILLCGLFKEYPNYFNKECQPNLFNFDEMRNLYNHTIRKYPQYHNRILNSHFNGEDAFAMSEDFFKDYFNHSQSSLLRKLLPIDNFGPDILEKFLDVAFFKQYLRNCLIYNAHELFGGGYWNFSLPLKYFNYAQLLAPLEGYDLLVCANCNQRESNYEAAVDYYTRCIDIFPIQAYYNRGVCYFDTSDFIKCIQDLSTFLANVKDYDLKHGEKFKDEEALVNSLKLRGISKYELHDYYGALNDFETLVSTNSENGEYYLWRGKTLLNLKQHKKGYLDLSKAGELGEHDAFDIIQNFRSGKIT